MQNRLSFQHTTIGTQLLVSLSNANTRHLWSNLSQLRTRYLTNIACAQVPMIRTECKDYIRICWFMACNSDRNTVRHIASCHSILINLVVCMFACPRCPRHTETLLSLTRGTLRTLWKASQQFWQVSAPENEYSCEESTHFIEFMRASP